ncbi:MAG: tyrosine-type recombinase/integrase [Treponema sp.]|nr:tyrosine-type recombinase/integrase [Treponema sp.]
MRKEFVFDNRRIDIEEFYKIVPDVSCVLVNTNSPDPIRVTGFFGRPWKQADYLKPAVQEEGGYTLPAKILPPMKFSKLWETRLETELRSRKYSPRTILSYIYFNRLLCVTLDKSPEDIQPDDITSFLASVEKEKEFSSSSMNLAISAIKFFYTNVLKKDIVREKTRPRSDKLLPAVLDKSEINKILSHEKNIKHRLLLMLVYSSGLRVSEVVALKREHIDLPRRVLHIKLGKGRKDRCTILSEKAVSLLTHYCTLYDIQDWLFPGQPPTRHLSIRSAQSIFDHAVQNAQISKNVSIHSLRHTFATHLLEGGTDIRYIQALLGHAALRTTERYAHVARRSVLSIKSPLDTI